jgi:DNA mismatch endonuclease (patch repair protein)
MLAAMDTLTPAERSARMARVKGKGSSAEMTVRRLVHRMGYRYRLHGGKLPGRPDLVFPSRKKAIFVHGCFWHRHPDPDCKLARLPKSRQDFWIPKLEGNRARDLRQLSELEALGWSALILWECGLKNEAFLENEIRTFLDA